MKSGKSSIAVIGAGNMGSGIAQKYATHGYQVVLVDQNSQNLTRSQKSIAELLKSGVAKGVFKDVEVKNILDRIKFTSSLNDCLSAELLIEAIFEDLALKRELFVALESMCNKDAIFATNTSSLKVSDLQATLKYPERLLGLHYFYHPAKNRLVEVIGAKATHPSILKRAKDIQENINKIIIEAKDSPGFIVNRFFVPWLNEASRIVEEGFATAATVDAAARAFFKISMGPFELMNVTGLPITLHCCQTFAKYFGNFYAPSKYIAQQTENGRPFPLSEAIEEDKFSAINMQLLSIVSTICSQMVFVENICTIGDVDLGARVGLLWKKGPFELLNDNLAGINKQLRSNESSPSLFVPPILQSHIKERKPFLQSSVVTSKTKNIGVIKLNRPDTLNALDEKLKDDLAQAFADFTNDDTIFGIVITGHRRAFMAGADLSFFNENLKKGSIESILAFAKSANELFLAIDQSQKPVVAAVSGVALGGGLELALACDAIMCEEQTTLAFPETGIGIYPGLGGTQRTPKKIGIPLARYLILTGATVNATEARAMGLVEKVTKSGEAVESAISYCQALASKDAVLKPEPSLSDYADLHSAFQPGLKVKDIVLTGHGSERVLRALSRINRKAPLAISIADELISQADKNTLVQGLDLEAAQLKHIFCTKDAETGLRAALTKNRAVFVGK